MWKTLKIVFAAGIIGACAPILDLRSIDGPAVSVLVPVPLSLTAAGGTSCNAVRIDGRTVATAAHCLSDGTTLRLREAGVTLATGDTLQHPAYDFRTIEDAGGFDLAKVFVASPNGVNGAVPIAPIQPGPVRILVRDAGGELREVPCTFLGRSGRLVELGCGVNLGWSGAPVVQDGALVGILSARGRGATAEVVQIADASLLESF